MKITIDFRNENDALDCSIMLNAFGHAHELYRDLLPDRSRIKLNYDAASFGQIAGEAGVFAPVQITVE